MVLILASGILAPAIGAVAATTDEQTIRDVDAEWSRAAKSKDAAKCASFYSETGSVMPFNAPIATGKTKVQEVWSQLKAKPDFSLHFAPTQIEVAKSKHIVRRGDVRTQAERCARRAHDLSREVHGGLEEAEGRELEGRGRYNANQHTKGPCEQVSRGQGSEGV
jgi:ketosteroid isomerase-like protein